jgi:PAS domain S-box-containing protein
LFHHLGDGILLAANPAFLALLGYSQAEFQYQRIPNINALTPPLFRDRDRNMYAQVRATRTPLFWQREFIHKTGRHIPVIAGVTWDEKHLAYLCSCYDISNIEKDRQLSSLAAQLLSRADQEKRAIARRLHDATAQNLAALAIHLSLLATELPQDTLTSQYLAECSGLTHDCLDEVRALSYTLHPPLLEELGLLSALRSYIEAFSRYTAIQTTLQILSWPHHLPRQTETRLFRIIQERLIYLQRNGDPTECAITLQDAGSATIVSITDNALFHPCDRDSEDLSVSLAAMRERARQAGAELSIESDSHGTEIRVILARS